MRPMPPLHARARSAGNDGHALDESQIDETLRESMPASDPPSWTQTHVGPPMRDGRSRGRPRASVDAGSDANRSRAAKVWRA